MMYRRWQMLLTVLACSDWYDLGYTLGVFFGLGQQELGRGPNIW